MCRISLEWGWTFQSESKRRRNCAQVRLQLRESEARFSAAFQASPIFIGISQMSNGHFVLVNDAFVGWSGYSRDEILGRSAL